MTGDKRENVMRLSAELQAELLKAGGRLAGLNPEQKWKRTRNNNFEGIDIPLTSDEEKDNKHMSQEQAQQSAASTPATSVTDIPPAGGDFEREIGRKVLTFVDTATKAAAADAKRKAERKWTDKAVDGAIISGALVTVIVGGYAGRRLVDRWMGPKTTVVENKLEAPVTVSALPNGGTRMKVG